MREIVVQLDKGRVIDELLHYLEDSKRELIANSKAQEEDTKLQSQLHEIDRIALIYRYLPRRDYRAEDDVIIPSALIKLQLGETGPISYCF